MGRSRSPSRKRQRRRSPSSSSESYSSRSYSSRSSSSRSSSSVEAWPPRNWSRERRGRSRSVHSSDSAKKHRERRRAYRKPSVDSNNSLPPARQIHSTLPTPQKQNTIQDTICFKCGLPGHLTSNYLLHFKKCFEFIF